MSDLQCDVEVSPRRFAILAVCTANICRSPMIEQLLRQRLDSEHFEVASAGVRGWSNAPMDEMAALELGRFGLDPGDFRSQEVHSHLIDSADLVLTATKEHRSAILRINPLALRRTFTLLEFAALAPSSSAHTCVDLVKEVAQRRSQGPTELDIADPYQQDPEVHRHVADEIFAAVETIGGVLGKLAR